MFQHWRGADHNKCTGVKMLIVIQDPRFYLVHKYQGLLTFIFLCFSTIPLTETNVKRIMVHSVTAAEK